MTRNIPETPKISTIPAVLSVNTLATLRPCSMTVRTSPHPFRLTSLCLAQHCGTTVLLRPSAGCVSRNRFYYYGKGVPNNNIVLPYSLYAQSRPVMLSVSAWNHTHGARYQNRTGAYRLEVCRSAINLIRRKEWATITAVTQGGFKEDEEYGKMEKA